jgi:hypothetical protein
MLRYHSIFGQFDHQFEVTGLIYIMKSLDKTKKRWNEEGVRPFDVKPAKSTFPLELFGPLIMMNEFGNSP